jgi:hypothetical protein
VLLFYFKLIFFSALCHGRKAAMSRKQEVPMLPFDRWCDSVCGVFRKADRAILEDLWRKDWLPQQAIEYLQSRRLFRRKGKFERRFWETWKEPIVPPVRRRRTISELQFKCRIAEAILGAIEKAKEGRLEPDLLAFANRLAAQCRDQLKTRERVKQERKAKRVTAKTAANADAGTELA